MAQIHWLKQISGGFDVAADWSTDTVPGPFDDAILDAPGSLAYTVNVWAKQTTTGVATGATATLSINAGEFTAANGTDGGVNAGLISVANGATFAVDGTILNTGAIALDAGAGDSQLLIGQGAAVIGGGRVTLSDSAGNLIDGVFTPAAGSSLASVSSLTNRGVISGAGLIGNNLRLVNGDVIDATGAAALTVTAGNFSAAGSTTIANNGVFEATNPGALAATGGLELVNATFHNAVGHGVIEAVGPATGVYLRSATIEGGTLAASDGGEIETLDSGSVLDGTTNPLTLSGPLHVSANTDLTVEGAIVNTGQVFIDADGTGQTNALLLGASVTLSGGGAVELGGVGSAIASASSGGATLTNVDCTISGNGQIGGAGPLTLINGGTIESGEWAGNFVYLTITNTTIDNTSGGTVNGVNNSPVILNNDTINGGTLGSSSYSRVSIYGGLVSGLNTPLTIVGSVEAPGKAVNIEGVIDNEGDVSGSLLVTANNATVTGSGEFSGSIHGVLTSVGGSEGVSSLVNDGTIVNGGEIGKNLSLTNNGLIDDSSGVTSIQTGLSSVAGSQTVINNGVIEATGYGHLALSGITLAGPPDGDVVAVTGKHAYVALYNVAFDGGTLVTGNGGTIRAFEADLLNGDGRPINNEGTLIDEGGNVNSVHDVLTLEGEIKNSGVILLKGDNWGGTFPATLVIGVATQLTGGGEVIMLDSPGGMIVEGAPGLLGKPASLTNVDNTITGAGTITADLTNGVAGMIDATGAMTINTGTVAIANAGLIEVTQMGVAAVLSAIANTGTLEVDTGTMTVSGAVTGTGSAVIAAGQLDFTSTFSQNVAFTGSSGELELADSQAYGGTIAGFSTTGANSIDLVDIGFVAASEANFVGTASGGVLTVTDGVHAAKIHLVGDYLGSVFTASSDGHGGTQVVDPPGASAKPGSPAPSVGGFIDAAASLAAPAAQSPNLFDSLSRVGNLTGGVAKFDLHTAIAAPQA